MTTPVLVDTNIPLVAKGISTAPDSCLKNCIKTLQSVIHGQHRVVLDSEHRILKEYMHKLSMSGQPTVGDAFLKWLYSNLGNELCCEMIDITAIDEQEQIFKEFPNVAGLETFDRSDRKFVAVANAHPEKPPILQGWDVKWVGWSIALKDANIVVEFICEHEIRSKYAENYGQPMKTTVPTGVVPTAARSRSPRAGRKSK